MMMHLTGKLSRNDNGNCTKIPQPHPPVVASPSYLLSSFSLLSPLVKEYSVENLCSD